MSLQFRKRVKLDDTTHVNISNTGASVSKKIGKRLTVNSRGRASIRLAPGLSFRFRLWK